MNRIPFLLGISLLLIYRLIIYFTGEVWLALLVFLIPVLLLVVNLSLRKRLVYKAWFLASGNVLLEKKTYSSSNEISADLLFDKLLEVIEDSEFQFYDSDRSKLQILCGTAVNFRTWGENVYIDLIQSETDETTVRFTSVTLFGSTSWQRNKQNYESFIASYEESLII